jgi:RHS repeat-associated protein
VRAITDSTGAIVKTFQTDEFGITLLTQGTSPEPFRFTGQERDAESGFYNLRARFYAPAWGRFVSRDRAFGSPTSPQSLNRYSYAGNNPVNDVDPSGLCGEDNTGQPQCSQSGVGGGGGAAEETVPQMSDQALNKDLLNSYGATPLDVAEG